MALNLSNLELVAHQLGAAVSEDVAAWSIVPERYGTVTLKLTTRDGKDFVFLGRRGNGSKAIPRCEPPPDRMKVCSRCDEPLPIKCFSRNRHSPDLHDWCCRECIRQRRKPQPSGAANRKARKARAAVAG